MSKTLREDLKQLYEKDYHLWVLETVKSLKQRELNSLDWENLIDEVLDLSKREKRTIESLLIRLFEYLLICQYWQLEKERNRGHWEREINNFRLQILRQLEDSPSLKPHLEQRSQRCYQDGRKLAAKHSQLSLETFPENAIAPLEKVLDENWLPNEELEE
ncbi:DUF29 domain-containing protein [Spirulina sp. CS-785/01]|uniref:DUF29 domain-containing protein n=1 Tax=Spirulina sp. CS-785/01 TaxID=3021716 RepID=UPI00232D395C|nr:DUF29 domain-containing protein [Spirulina sp. CS-785/01]MDB9312947.1 DUF29 domain-containing protein [Spirulina sp. CS-785/01]